MTQTFPKSVCLSIHLRCFKPPSTHHPIPSHLATLMATYQVGSYPSMSHSSSQAGTTVLQPPHGWEESFADDIQHLWLPSEIDVLEEPPTPLQFSRDYVSVSRPCIIRHAIVDPMTGRPLHLTLDDICQRLDPLNTRLTVDVTPDGHGDCVRQVLNDASTMDKSSQLMVMFVQPKECTMTLEEFKRKLRHQPDRQNLRNRKQSAETRCSSDPLPSDVNDRFDVNGLPAVRLGSSGKISSPSEACGATETATDTVAVAVADSSESSSTNGQPLLPDNSIVYFSRQNDCLRTPDPSSPSLNIHSHPSITDLATLFPAGLDWAQQAFGTSLDAVNLWIGNAASVSSMHKDHYENLFYVASGEKVFCICPPADAPFLYQHVEYPSGKFDYSNDSWHVRPCSNDIASIDNDGEESAAREPSSKVRWIYPDVSQLQLSTITKSLEGSHSDHPQQGQLLEQEFPLLRHAHPIEIHVRAGELLYLPALWFHRVTQTCETIGVNYWYDMRFDSPMWCYFHLLQESIVVVVAKDNEGSEQKSTSHESAQRPNEDMNADR